MSASFRIILFINIFNTKLKAEQKTLKFLKFRLTFILMKSFSFFSVLLSCFILNAQQPNTEIFLFDASYDSSELKLLNPKNISNNEGYDNQPSFFNDNAILFSSTRNGQTDIVEYRDNYGSKTWLCFTEGGEYTPLKIPNSKNVSAVRLDKDGKQRLYAYNLRTADNSELIKDLVVAYYTWFNEDIIVSAVIEDENLNLYTTNLKEGWNRKYQSNVGRSFHKIPNSNLVSFISKENEDNWQIKSLNPLTGETKVIANTMPGVEDICWLINGTIISGKDSKLYKLKPKYDVEWIEIADLSPNSISKITRIASNAISSKILIAAEITSNTSESNNQSSSDSNSNSGSTSNSDSTSDAGAIVQSHIGPYNAGDLNGFSNAFAENVVVSRYPNEKMYEGRQTLKQKYTPHFKNNKNLSVRVNNRIVLNDYVIDEELTTMNNGNGRQATIYTTGKEGIKTMTFVSNTNVTSNPEIIVNKQLEAYNRRDIDAFMKTYTNDVKLFNYPNDLTTEGQSAMRKSYLSWFDYAKDLRAVIQKRIVIGNKVIDQEQVTANGRTINAIAIYEVENGLISKVTFIQ